RIELEHWNGDVAWDLEQMIDQAKCLVEFAGPGINLGEVSGCLRPIQGVLGRRKLLNSALALGNGFLLLTGRRQDEAMLGVSGRVFGSFWEQVVRDQTGRLQRRL